MLRYNNPRRRDLLAGISILISSQLLQSQESRASASIGSLPTIANPIPLNKVRLKDSIYLNAIRANMDYLLKLSPDRFLHNYHKFAGLPVKGKIYGGWESDTIAGEGLGHYLSALSLMYAQTGDINCKARVDYIIAELGRIQATQPDGYIAGFMRRRKDGTIVNGKEIFPEIMAGDIRSAGFDLNGCWVPFYNWHKLFAGLMDAETLCTNKLAIPIAIKLGNYIEKVFAALSDEQVQKVLACEYGGLNESFAELSVRTGDSRWLNLAKRLYHNAVFLPLEARQDKLQNIHANTQVPKVIGLARLYEITKEPKYNVASQFFWDRVVNHHSFVIGGNADREYFFEPDHQHEHLTEQTCESCNSYNMMKLTRHLFSWSPNSIYFDYYEKAHLNHIMAHQNPKTSMFTYMMPMMSGTAREFSTPEDSFWCCVLSGLESHSKHGDSIYFEGKDTLFVNLYIPSKLEWAQKNTQIEMSTKYPYEGAVNLTVTPSKSSVFQIALRKPNWSQTKPIVMVNGKLQYTSEQNGYILLKRRWNKGDTINLDFKIGLSTEIAAPNNKMVVLKHGPMVLAADLGEAPKSEENSIYDGPIPVIVTDNILQGIKVTDSKAALYETNNIIKPNDVKLMPFYSMYERRTAIYFNNYTPSEWDEAKVLIAQKQAKDKEIANRSVDIMYIGEMQPERDHNLQSDFSYPVIYRGKNGRDARSLGYFSFEMKTSKAGEEDKPLVLQVTYWGGENNRDFAIEIDGVSFAKQLLQNTNPNEWLEIEYPIPFELTKGKKKITIRFQPKNGKTAGPVFGIRLFTAK